MVWMNEDIRGLLVLLKEINDTLKRLEHSKPGTDQPVQQILLDVRKEEDRKRLPTKGKVGRHGVRPRGRPRKSSV